MQGMLDLTGSHAQDFATNVGTISGQVKKAGNSINGWSTVQGDFNQQIAEAKEMIQVFAVNVGDRFAACRDGRC